MRQLLYRLFAVLIRDQQQDVDPIPDDSRVLHGHHGRSERDRVVEHVAHHRIDRVFELRLIRGARHRNRRGDLDHVRRCGIRERRDGKADERRQHGPHVVLLFTDVRR